MIFEYMKGVYLQNLEFLLFSYFIILLIEFSYFIFRIIDRVMFLGNFSISFFSVLFFLDQLDIVVKILVFVKRYIFGCYCVGVKLEEEREFLVKYMNVFLILLFVFGVLS